MQVTVAICTRNRCFSLGRTLQSLAEMRVPDGLTWNVVVADNGSTDATPATIARFSSALSLTTIEVPATGKAHALNAAMHEARGDYILWTDDDVVVGNEWLHAYHQAFLQWPADVFFGGPIVPVFEGTRPQWLDGALRHVANAYAARDLGEAMIPLAGDALPYGANWAIQRAAQLRHPYDARLGPKGDQLSYGEEWAVMEALLRAGASGRWVPRAAVKHVISPARQTVRYLRRYYVGNGTSLARVRDTGAEPMLFGRPRWLWREAVVQECAYRVRRLYAGAEVWSEHLRRASVAWGMLRIPQHRP
jgi:glycosyltransferase involved in cell wall biosynthesis